MTKVRVFLSLLTILVVGFLGYLAILYAKGYRLNPTTLKFTPSGILVVKTNPSGAQIFINNELRGASDSNFSLSPGTYDVEIKKNSFLSWYKRLTLEKETVTEADVTLFKSTPSFTPITLSGVSQPTASSGFSQITYADANGLWIIENINFPIGFSKDPRRITDGDLTGSTPSTSFDFAQDKSLGASWEFSPDGREILLSTSNGIFQIDSGSFTPQSQRINVATKKDQIIISWNKEREAKLNGQIRNLPGELIDILQRKASDVSFSPDETKILYTASASALLAPNLIKPLPGASTQKEDRDIKIDHTYTYDIKEDRNFLIASNLNPLNQTIFWLPNSKNLVSGEPGKITVMDYDGTNQQVVFSGGYTPPYVFPYGNGEKLLILTNLGADSQLPNLYSISIK